MSHAKWSGNAPDLPYGFRVTIERNRLGRVETHVFPSKTKALSQATQAARYKGGYLRLISAEPLTAEQWAIAFGQRKREAVLA
jgi:hypothetical protein